jgi:UDP-glucose 4-epimerase
MMLAEMQIKNSINAPVSMNFGPASSLSVEDLIELFEFEFKCKLNKSVVKSKIKEHESLRLNSEFAYQTLGWRNIYDSKTAISVTANWYARFNHGEGARELMLQDLNEYQEMNVDL